MQKLKATCWNIKWLNTLMEETGNPTAQRKKDKRLKAVCDELVALNPDVLCLIEGCVGEDKIDFFCQTHLNGQWQAIKLADSRYAIRGRQWIWFLVRTDIAANFSLQSPTIWQSLVGDSSWPVHYWGDFDTEKHNHYRHPQVLVSQWAEQRIEFIGLHTKSKFVSRGKSDWKAGGSRQEKFIKSAIKARIKMTTEVTNVRQYINKRFEQTANPAIIVMGDLNDGPGKEHIESKYLFFDLMSNLQGDVFFSKRFLTHALFDYDESLRWSCFFKDYIDPARNPRILLDHILYTQPLIDGSLPFQVQHKSGLIEHEVHDLVNAAVPKYAETSDHKPVSITLSLTQCGLHRS
ncbi:MAG: hypothetical protein ACI8WB_001207 [Phenylobacterium sp.]|jgi:hypothetical protein